MNKQKSYCGVVSIIGRSNVGKSTLINQLVGHKVSITSHKPNTTRYCITGIHTEKMYQTIYLDTPGLYTKKKLAKNKLFDHIINRSVIDVNLIIFMVEGIYWTIDDKILLSKLYNMNCPVLLVINKIDNLIDKKKLLPHIQFLSQQMSFYEIIPICAKSGMNIEILTQIVHKALPESVHHFPNDYITDHSKSFIASEIIREKLMRFLGDELPYSAIVNIDHFVKNDRGDYNIYGIILIDRENQKKIVVGKNGNKIRIINITSRKEMEHWFKKQVNLKLWVKVKSS